MVQLSATAQSDGEVARMSEMALVQPLDVGDDRRHLVDRVDAALGHRAVRRAPLGAHLHLHAPPLPAVDAQVGRLGDHHHVGRQHLLAQDVLPAEAVAILLHHGAGDPELDAVEEVELPGDRRAVDRGGEAPLLIARAAAVDDAVLHLALVGVAGPGRAVADADGVEMAVERDDHGPAADPAEQVAETVDLHLVEAEPLHLDAGALDHRALLTALRGDRDHLAQEADDLGRAAFGERGDLGDRRGRVGCGRRHGSSSRGRPFQRQLR